MKGLLRNNDIHTTSVYQPWLSCHTSPCVRIWCVCVFVNVLLMVWCPWLLLVKVAGALVSSPVWITAGLYGVSRYIHFVFHVIIYFVVQKGQLHNDCFHNYVIIGIIYSYQLCQHSHIVYLPLRLRYVSGITVRACVVCSSVEWLWFTLFAVV